MNNLMMEIAFAQSENYDVGGDSTVHADIIVRAETNRLNPADIDALTR